MFEFYLAASEISFRRSTQMVWQVQLAHDKTAVPLTRDYITAAEMTRPLEFDDGKGQPAAPVA